MPREQNYTGIILKKQPFGEADEIITFFTKESGKIRGPAKSVKLAKSKLQSRLQALFLGNVVLAENKLPKIISVEVAETFANIRENLQAAKMAFYASETVLKFTPDEQKNEQLFNALVDFLNFLNSEKSESILSAGLAKFKIQALESLGFSITVAKNPSGVYFSAFKGGFTSEKFPDALPVNNQTYQGFVDINKYSFSQLNQLQVNNTEELQQLLSSLVEYHLERPLKSEKYLRGDMV